MAILCVLGEATRGESLTELHIAQGTCASLPQWIVRLE